MRVLDTATYRECSKIREYCMSNVIGSYIQRGIITGFLVGTIDIVLVTLITRNVADMAARILIGIIAGIFSGFILYKLWNHLYIKTAKKLKEIYWDVEILTSKIEALQEQEENKEDYELVGEKK